MTELIVTTDDGVDLRTRADGCTDAPPLLLLNSLGTDLAMWDPQVAAWTRTHRVLRFDHRGHGLSEGGSAPYTIDQLGSDAVTVLNSYGAERADVCGLSLGGLVALWLAVRADGRVRRLVLADTAARIGTEAAWRDRATTVRRRGTAAITELVLSRCFSPSFVTRGEPAVQDLQATLHRMSPCGYAASCDVLATTDLTDLVPQVQVETLVLVGSEDAATPPTDAAALHAALERSHLEELPGAGHLSNLEEPERFANVVADFLTSDRAT